MENKISKTCDAALARATFDLVKADIRNSYKDRLALVVLREKGSMAYNTLSTLLKDWELSLLTQRIESMINTQPKQEAISPEEFMQNYRRLLISAYNYAKTISTIHILRDVVCDTNTATSQVLAFYGISAQSIDQAIESLTQPTRLMQSDVQFSSPSLIDTPTEIGRSKKIIDKIGIDLTQKAREGEIDPVIGREKEIERLIQILARRKKNNPILIGQAGVGKSAIVEGLALKIVSGEVPISIRNKRIFSLDVSSLVAGTKFRGEFEERMQQLLDELRSDKQTILFIDEIHTIVGAGASQGSLDTANILKPALARGELQTIGATTLDEYRENIENDAALERRFQRVMVEPTTPSQTLEILRRITPYYERHHNVRYSDEALRACVELSERYISERDFPDKAIDIMDEAGARSQLTSTHQPEWITHTEMELAKVKAEHQQAIGELRYEKAAEARLREIALKARLREQQAEWMRQIRREPIQIGISEIENIITSMTGIPIEQISSGEMERYKGLRTHLSRRVVGQTQAVERICRSLIHSRAGLRDENRPIGVFLFVGPTGVGKTLLAKELSQWLFDKKRGLIRLDMSEYSEKHNIARLIGSPPGYVGYGQGGQLSEAVRRQPYSVILFDEIEKAHPEVYNIMLQIFDEGRLTDGYGREIDFRNTIIILTSNIGSRNTVEKSIQVGFNTPSKQLNLSLTPSNEYSKALESQFAPEFLNRIDDVIYFRSLEQDDIRQIIDLELEKIVMRTHKIGVRIEITADARQTLSKMGYEPRYGVRALRRLLLDKIEEPLSLLIIEHGLQSGASIRVDTNENDIELRVA